MTTAARVLPVSPSLSPLAPHLTPLDATDEEALRGLTPSLDEARVWSRWSQLLPMAPGALDTLTRIEHERQQIAVHVPFLARICQHPRTSLRLDEERLPVDRARRIPERAVATLLTHPEDWAGRTLRGIHASRVLSTVAEDDPDLYENRLAVQLLHHLLRWSTRRLEWLRRRERMEREASDFSSETGGTHWRSQRLCTLWGSLVTDQELGRRTVALRQSVESLHRSLLRLLDSPLARQLESASRSPLTLRPTNLLTHDPLYRKLAALWTTWLTLAQPRETERERGLRQAQGHDAFVSFARLLVVRALASLGYQPEGDPELSLPQGRALLASSLGPAELRWQTDSLQLQLSGRTLHIDVIPAGLPREHMRAWWTSLHTLSPADDRLVLLHGTPNPALLDTLEPALARALCGWSWPRVLLVSPWSLDAIERVARVLRGWEITHRLGHPLPRLSLRSKHAIPGHWHTGSTHAHLSLLAPPTPRDLRELEQWHLHQQTTLARPSRPTHAESARLDAHRADLDTVRTFLDAIQQRRVTAWRTCPLCKSEEITAESRETARTTPLPDAPAWRCQCRSCQAEWGLWRCGDCQRTYPVLKHPEAALPAALPPWMADQHWGHDLWAEPRRTEQGSSFACSWCARQQDRGSTVAGPSTIKRP